MTTKSNYGWMESYRAALLETDPEKLKTLLPIAQQELSQRQLKLVSDAGNNHLAERSALEDALRILRVVEKELTRKEQD